MRTGVEESCQRDSTCGEGDGGAYGVASWPARSSPPTPGRILLGVVQSLITRCRGREVRVACRPPAPRGRERIGNQVLDALERLTIYPTITCLFLFLCAALHSSVLCFEFFPACFVIPVSSISSTASSCTVTSIWAVKRKITSIKTSSCFSPPWPS